MRYNIIIAVNGIIQFLLYKKILNPNGIYEWWEVPYHKFSNHFIWMVAVIWIEEDENRNLRKQIQRIWNSYKTYRIWSDSSPLSTGDILLIDR